VGGKEVCGRASFKEGLKRVGFSWGRPVRMRGGGWGESGAAPGLPGCEWPRRRGHRARRAERVARPLFCTMVLHGHGFDAIGVLLSSREIPPAHLQRRRKLDPKELSFRLCRKGCSAEPPLQKMDSGVAQLEQLVAMG